MADVYESVRYAGHAFPQTHPDRLALLARLHGLAPAPPDRCRLLELGCGDGTNVVGMAAAAPRLEAVGIDRAAAPLQTGRAAAGALGLVNVELLAADLRELSAGTLGVYDYVVAHGVWSWASADVRRALLELCAEVLAPHGVAFVSYTALPGGALRAMTREIGLWRARGAGDPLAGAEQVRATLAALAPWMRGREDPYARVLAAEADRVLARSAHELVHDELGDVYAPTWAGDFAEAAAAAGLRFLCEAEPAELRDDWLPAGAGALLDELGGEDPVARAQAADLLIGRAFRQTLLCRATAPASSSPQAIDGLRIGPERRPLAGEDPAAVLTRFRQGEVELHAAPARYVTAPGERPEAFGLARHQAAASPDVTNLRHEHVRLQPSARELVRLLDGTRDRDGIAVDLAAALGQPERADGVRAGLDGALAALAAVALLRA